MRVLPLAGFLTLMVAIWPLGGARAEAPEPLVGVVHVHTKASTGNLSIEELARLARAQGIDAVLLADNFQLEFAFDLFPLAGLLSLKTRFPSLSPGEMASYLEEIERVSRKEGIILIPGVETVPFYFWTGRLWRGDLTLHDGQKNILVMGLRRPEDYKRLPLATNPASGGYSAWSLVRASPLLLVALGLGLLSRRRLKRYRIGGFIVSRRQRPWLLASILLVVGGGWSIYNAPFTVPSYWPLAPGRGLEPHQRLIDYADSLGAVTVWSYPEAIDREFHRLPLGGLTTRTEAHPEVLAQTDRYTAFGALYLDITTAEKPGRAWDRALEDFCLGRRQKPPWGLGELGFHQAGSKRLTDVLTLFFTRSPTAQGVLEALKAGRMYALIPNRDFRLVLKTFVIRAGTREARMGETLSLSPGSQVELQLDLDVSDGTRRPLEGVVVRNGRAWKRLRGMTPFSVSITDVPPTRRRCSYYRLWVSKPHPLLTNPVFVGQGGLEGG